jgi:hypothetical protein
MSIEWTDQFIYPRDQDLVFYNLFTYDRLVYGHMLLMEHVWLMNHGSIANGIIYGPENMKIESYVILIFLFDLYRYISPKRVCQCSAHELDRTEPSRLLCSLE